MLDKIAKWFCVTIGVLFLLASLLYVYLFGALYTQQGITSDAVNYLGVSVVFALLGLYPVYKALPSKWR